MVVVGGDGYCCCGVGAGGEGLESRVLECYSWIVPALAVLVLLVLPQPQLLLRGDDGGTDGGCTFWQH